MSSIPHSSEKENIYYARHLRLPGFTITTQDKLRNAKVLIIGMGGLGCPAARYLAGAGVGSLVLCDADTVSITNLHRQILYTEKDVGQKKVDVAKEAICEANPYIQVSVIDSALDTSSLDTLIPQFDVVLDGTDNFDAKYAINDACEKYKVPLVYGSIFQFEGQVSVFHYPTDGTPDGFSFRDVYPSPPPAALAQNCGEAGVIGVLPGIVGLLQANEVIKVITGLGQPLAGNLLVFDALTALSRQLPISKQTRSQKETSIPELSFESLQDLIKKDTNVLLVDVRDLNEREVGHLGGLHIPLLELPNHLATLKEAKSLILYCKSGVRSAQGFLYLETVLPNVPIKCLKGGVDGAACGISM